MNYREFMARLSSEPLELNPEWGRALSELALSHRPTDDVAGEEVLQVLQLEAAVRVNPRASGSIAIIPLRGFMQPREDIWTRLGFATSTEAFARNVRQAAVDPNVKVVLFDVDSGGGFVSGTEEASAAIFKLRGQKPMVAVANMMMASAAYYVSSSADEIVGSPSSLTGSIGVWTVIFDQMAAWEMFGVKPYMIKAGQFKAIGNAYEPVTDEVVARIQARVDEEYGMFVNAVARNRNAKAADVRNGFGQGDVLLAKDALAAKLIDKIATFEETLARFGAPAAAGGFTTGADREPAAERASLERELERRDLIKS